MWIRPLDGSAIAASSGAKASGLARLLAAGLPVPEGFVITDEAFRAVVGEANLPRDVEHLGHALDQLAAAIEASEPSPELAAAVAAQVARLGPVAPMIRLAVRSSISLEDRGAGAAAGVFSSRLAVAPDDLWPAIRAVWASVCTPLAAAYARHTQAHRQRKGARPDSPLTVAVIVQRYVPGKRLTIYTRPPGQPSSSLAWIERGEALRKLERAAEDPALALALAAERALQLEQGGADVELIEDPRGHLVVVQARPIVHPAMAPKMPAPSLVISALVADGRRWTADFAHNPDPLSPAQAGLIERIEREGKSPYSLRLCAGYLYSTPRALRQVSPPLTAEELQRRFAAIEDRAAAALGVATPDDLPATLEAFLRFYQVWAGEMSPLVSAARLAAIALTTSDGSAAPLQPARAGTRRSAVDTMVMACARGELGERELLERIGDLAPAWDVAVPTLAETPEWIATALARARLRVSALAAAPATLAAPAAPAAPVAPAAPAALAAPAAPAATPLAPALAPGPLSLGDVASELAELDDVWFAHAQARVRRALIARGEALAIGRDVFWLPLEDVLAAVVDLEGVKLRASAARAAHRRASAWRMPAVVGGVVVQMPRWRGVGCGGVVTGRVVHIPNLWELPVLPLGAIAVTPAVTPALAVALVGAAAIVSETGGLLDHGAAMARELGIPCVVGCTDAMSLPPHALVTVDGDAGAVIEMSSTDLVSA